MRIASRVALFAAAHLLASLALLAVSAGAAAGGLGTGAPPSAVERVASTLTAILLLPVASPAIGFLSPRGDLGAWGYLLFALNSLVWGAGVYLLFRFFRRDARGPILRQRHSLRG